MLEYLCLQLRMHGIAYFTVIVLPLLQVVDGKRQDPDDSLLGKLQLGSLSLKCPFQPNKLPPRCALCLDARLSAHEGNARKCRLAQPPRAVSSFQCWPAGLHIPCTCMSC